MRLKIKVPATTANMGPGFDSVGMAFQVYNHLEVIADEVDDNPLNKKLTIHAGDGIPTNEENLIYQTIADFLTNRGIRIPSLTLRQNDQIPTARGLGSSAACIVAGLLAADALAETNLPQEALVNIAARLDGHGDNTTPAIVGGLVVTAIGSRVEYIQIPAEPWKGLRFAVMIPNFSLLTAEARQALPENYPRQDAVHNISRAALLIAAFATGDYWKLATALDDRIHQPYRMPLVPNMDAIIAEANKNGAIGAFLSGAGPTLIAVTEDAGFLPRMDGFLKGLTNRWDIRWVEPDHAGATIERVV